MRGTFSSDEIKEGLYIIYWFSRVKRGGIYLPHVRARFPWVISANAGENTVVFETFQPGLDKCFTAPCTSGAPRFTLVDRERERAVLSRAPIYSLIAPLCVFSVYVLPSREKQDKERRNDVVSTVFFAFVRHCSSCFEGWGVWNPVDRSWKIK